MKNIKKFLFIFTIIFTGFCCEIKVSAFSCHYNAYAPFETTSKDPKELAYILNFKYAYKKVLNHSNDEYISLLSNLKQKYLVGNKYIKSISVKHYQDDHSNMNKEKIDLTSSDDTWAVLISSSGGTFDVANGALSKTSFYTNSCFDVFAIGNINNIQFAPTIDIDYSNRGFDDIDDVRIKEPMYNAISDEMKKNFYNEHTPILLINSSSDQTLSMATIFIKVGYYGVDFDKEYNIDSIVDKYLGIDGIKNILDVINENDDKDSANNNIVNTIKDSIVKIVDKVDLDSITNDLTELEKFNDNFAVVLNKKDGNFGIRQTLKQYLYGIGSGMSVTEWFNEYAADSKAQYVESLVELLEILNSNETKNEVNSKNELEDLARNYGYCRINFNFDEEKIKENCMESCKNYQEFKKEYDCRNSGNPSACVASYPSNFCTGKTSEEIANDMNKKKEEIDNNIEETLEKKIIEYYENKGIEIGNTDFCDILVGKDNKTGLYPYIKIVLNITRIGGPILVAILTGLDVMKVISSFKDDENKKFWNHLKIRLICLVILILVPTIINFLVKLVIESACKVEI